MVKEELKVTKIIDFTHLLKEKDHYVVFNPCVTHYKDNLYLCCARVITKNIILDRDYPDEFPEIDHNVYSNPNHPWRFNWTINNKEIPNKYLEYTKFAMLKISEVYGEYTIELVKLYNELFHDFMNSGIDKNNIFEKYTLLNNSNSNANTLLKYYTRLQDTRIHQTPLPNIFFITGNSYGRDNEQSNRINQHQYSSVSTDNCSKRDCTFISISSIEVDPVSLKIKFLNKTPTTLCRNLSSTTEKNWSIVFKDQPTQHNLTFYITYQITESLQGHELMRSVYNITSHTFTSQCIIVNQSIVDNYNHPQKIIKLSFYNMIEEAFKDNNGRKILHISTTTPTIKYNDKEFISVGHVKFLYDDKSLIPSRTPALHKFIVDLSNQIINFHRSYVYLFFFYTFSSSDGRLLRTSHFILPQPADVSLIFPMGLTRVQNNDFCLSYGNYDTTCEAMFLSKENVENSLMDITSFPFLIGNSQSQLQAQIRDYDFFRYSSWTKSINKIILK